MPHLVFNLNALKWIFKGRTILKWFVDALQGPENGQDITKKSGFTD